MSGIAARKLWVSPFHFFPFSFFFSFFFLFFHSPDEPTTGLHFADIERLLLSLNRLVENGHTVLVIEHNLDVIKTADYIIDLALKAGIRVARSWPVERRRRWRNRRPVTLVSF